MHFSKPVILILFLTCCWSCGKTDIAFVNQVKMFEPKWVELSEKFSYVQRNLNLTQKRYEADLAQTESLFSSVSGDRRIELINLRSQYREMVTAREEINERYLNKSSEFSDLVYEFNEWENRLMNGKLDEEEARAAFIQYKEAYDELDQTVKDLQTDLLKNIELHNSILRSMTKELEIFTNYDIQAK